MHAANLQTGLVSISNKALLCAETSTLTNRSTIAPCQPHPASSPQNGAHQAPLAFYSALPASIGPGTDESQNRAQGRTTPNTLLSAPIKNCSSSAASLRSQSKEALVGCHHGCEPQVCVAQKPLIAGRLRGCQQPPQRAPGRGRPRRQPRLECPSPDCVSRDTSTLRSLATECAAAACCWPPARPPAAPRAMRAGARPRAPPAALGTPRRRRLSGVQPGYNMHIP